MTRSTLITVTVVGIIVGLSIYLGQIFRKNRSSEKRRECLSHKSSDFLRASEAVVNRNIKTSNEIKLKLYALYKQATVGDIPATYIKPSVLDVKENAKYNAWLSENGKPSADAEVEYIELVSALLPDWRNMNFTISPKSNDYISEEDDEDVAMRRPSRPVAMNDLATSDTIFSYTLDGDVDVVKSLVSSDNVNQVNDVGESLMHCAADSGIIELLELFLSLGADVNARTPEDGLTPLDYAEASEQEECVKFLLSVGGKKSNDKF